MRCQFYDLLRRRGNVHVGDCEEEATRSLPENDEQWLMCEEHFDQMVEILLEWVDGGSTYRHEMMAKQYFEKHPELLEETSHEQQEASTTQGMRSQAGSSRSSNRSESFDLAQAQGRLRSHHVQVSVRKSLARRSSSKTG